MLPPDEGVAAGGAAVAGVVAAGEVAGSVGGSATGVLVAAGVSTAGALLVMKTPPGLFCNKVS